MSAPTRRAVLAGLSDAGLTVPALTALPAVAEGHPDAELFRIVQEFEDANLAWDVALADKDDRYILARKEYPQPPPVTDLITPEVIEDAFRRVGDDGETAEEDDESRLVKQRVRESWNVKRAAHAACCRVIDERYGLPEAAARATALGTQNSEAAQRVYQTPAKTGKGLAIKLRVMIQGHNGCEIDDETLDLFLADAERLGRGSC